jgi:hypothetical protein
MPSSKVYCLNNKNSLKDKLKISKFTVLPTRESLNLVFMAKLDEPETMGLIFLWWSVVSFRNDEGLVGNL